MDIWLGAAIVFATLFGPILAVLVTRSIDKRGQRRARQMEVFRALMRSRRSALSPEYVTGLNTIEVEFAGVKPIENAQRELFRHLSLYPQPSDWLDRLRRLQTRLLFAMAKYLGYEMEQLDVLEGGYLPQAWGNAEEEQTALRRALLQLLAGTQRLRVELAPPSPTTPSPLQTDHQLTPEASKTDVDGLYLIRYVGQADSEGFGTLFLGKGKLWGNDLVGGHYDGTYQLVDGKILGDANGRVPAGAILVTGYRAETETSLPIKFELPSQFAGPDFHPVSVGDRTVRVSFQKIRES
jgi:hypothetical protein